MRSRLLRKAAAVSMAVVALACATAHSGEASAPTAALPGTPGCFWLKSFNDWTVLNDSELIVHAPLTQDAYLVKLFQPVFGLNYYFNLGFVDVMQNGYICGPSRDYLAVPRYTPPRIIITAVQKLSASEQVQLLQAAKKPVPRVLLKAQAHPAASTS